ILHFGDHAERAIHLGRADAHPIAVEGRVRASQYPAVAFGIDLEKVPVPPDAGKLLEIGLEVATVARIVPEAQRHRRHGLGDHELADLVDNTLAARVVGLDRHPERGGLDLAGAYRERRHAPDEPCAAIRAAAAVGDPEVLLHIEVEPGHALRARGRAGEIHRAQRLEPEPLAWHDPQAAELVNVGGARAEGDDARLLR